MKAGLHPNYQMVQVGCACGHSFTTQSTKKDIKLEICSACHPFFTGKQRFVDTEGRIDKFLKKFEQTKAHSTVVAEKRKKEIKAAKKAAQNVKKTKVLSTRPVAAPKKPKK